jgi:hypothetical protein
VKLQFAQNVSPVRLDGRHRYAHLRRDARASMPLGNVFQDFFFPFA